MLVLGRSLELSGATAVMLEPFRQLLVLLLSLSVCLAMLEPGQPLDRLSAFCAMPALGPPQAPRLVLHVTLAHIPPQLVLQGAGNVHRAQLACGRRLDRRNVQRATQEHGLLRRLMVA